MARDGEAWFAAKRYGYGAGLPIRRQGWIALAALLLVIGGAAAALPRHPVAAWMAIIAAVAAFSAVAMRRTQCGWRWRDGER